MAAQTQISMEEYLRTSYRPDREYIDGGLRERNVGSRKHSRSLAVLAGWLSRHEDEWDVIGALGWRTRVSQTRVRVPDLVAVRPGKQPDVLDAAPVLVVEVRALEDTDVDMRERVADYQQLSAQGIWIVDPETHTGQMCFGDSWIAAETLTVPGTTIYVELPELFRSLDDPKRS